MAKKQREKGARGEREWAAWLNEHTGDGYYWARNGRNGIGSADVVPDPKVAGNMADTAWEVKRRDSLGWLQRGMEQAMEADRLLAIRFDGDRWWVMMPAEDYIEEYL